MLRVGKLRGNQESIENIRISSKITFTRYYIYFSYEYIRFH